MGHYSLFTYELVPSSRGLGRGPLKAKTRVRLPLGPPENPLKSKFFPYEVPIINLQLLIDRRNRYYKISVYQREIQIIRFIS